MKYRKIDWFVVILLSLIAVQTGVNLVGALGPELAFDALWYHLTIPKLYLLNHAIIHIPGSLLYYSDMPKLTEMLYTAALSFGNEITAKLIHFAFGLLTSLALYKLASKFLGKQFSLLAVLIFYSNLVVDWESITAYVDLARAFFETVALLKFIDFVEEKKNSELLKSAISLGFAVSVKLLALGSIIIYLSLILYGYLMQGNKRNFVLPLLFFSTVTLTIVSPWLIFSFIHTGNPVYPFFSGLYPYDSGTLPLLNPVLFTKDFWFLFTHADDPLSPLYIMMLPAIIVFIKHFSWKEKIIALFSLGGFIAWYAEPRTGGGRFILPYLPAFSLLTCLVISRIKFKTTRELLIITACILSISSISYRGIANARFIPVILGVQSKQDFLTKNLNFSFGDFYDVDGYFKKRVKSSQRVLVSGIHNLYYVDFPFEDISWAKKTDTFNYLLIRGKPPSAYKNLKLVYTNTITNVKLYAFQ